MIFRTAFGLARTLGLLPRAITTPLRAISVIKQSHRLGNEIVRTMQRTPPRLKPSPKLNNFPPNQS